MNFFGHCAIAGWQRPDPEFALGSMLPDFATIIGGGRVHSNHPALADGIAFHHATDEVFHDSRIFVHLQAEARRALAAKGVARGARLATAHVGLELMLDAELARDPRARDHYHAALESDAARSLETLVTWSAPREPETYERLRQTLLRRRAVVVPRTAGDLFERLERVLRSRPALALSPTARGAVESWASSVWPQLRQLLPQWLSELRSGLQISQALPHNTDRFDSRTPPCPQ